MVQAADVIRHRNDFHVVSFIEAEFPAALDLFRRRSDKNWSLTDCSSFLIMQKMAISEALTYDLHFEQAGFRALLRD
jgi:predicted nucleic acid-binding protein